MDEAQIIEIINRSGPTGGRKQAAESAKLAGLAHLVEPILAHEWPPVEGRTSGFIFTGDNEDDDGNPVRVRGNLKPVVAPLPSNGMVKPKIATKKAMNSGSHDEFNFTALVKAIAAAVADPSNAAKAARAKVLFDWVEKADPSTHQWIIVELGEGRWDVTVGIPGISRAVSEENWSKALSIASEMERLDSSSRNKWIVNKIRARDWDPYHKPDTTTANQVENMPGFGRYGPPAFLAEAIKRQRADSPKHGHTEAMERARIISEAARQAHGRGNGRKYNSRGR